MKELLKEWMILEKKIKELKDKKETITTKLMLSLKENKMIGYKILLPEYDIKCSHSNEYESISRKYLHDKLKRYYKNEKKAEDIVKYLYDERKQTKKLKIRKIKKL